MKFEKSALSSISLRLLIALCISSTISLPSFGFVKVLMKTNMGNIELILNNKKAPKTVANFLKYSKSGFYKETIFHRVIDNFMIQGGGFSKGLIKKANGPSIVNEASNSLSNLRGSIAMARTNVINSATSQFFINLKDNTFLDHHDNSSRGFGYAVFGKVSKGMSIVNKIAKIKTTTKNGMQNVPVSDIVIKSIKIIK